MKNFRVKFSVDGRPGGVIYVEALDSLSAKMVTLAELNGRPGYADKRIVITSVIQERQDG